MDYHALLAALVALIIGFVLGRRRPYAHRGFFFQNQGEARLSRALKARFVPPAFHLLNHVTLRLKDGTTQVDHILVSRFGVFVIETKNYNGWIFAGQNDPTWTQVLYRVKHRFQNPIHQNYRHVCAVRELLDFLPADAIFSCVVFVGEAEFKTTVPGGVFSLDEFITYVRSHTTERLSINRVQFCVGRLEAARLSLTMDTDVEHAESLRNRFGHYD